MEYVSGEDATNNKHLAEALDTTREGSAPPDGTTGYDEVQNPGSDVETLRDSCFHVAIEELGEIDNAPKESQEIITEVQEMLQNARYADDSHRAQVMAEAHSKLQEIWVPPE